jgi:hypothetical protein
MKVVMIRSNTFVPDIRLQSKILGYLTMAKTYLRSDEIVLRIITVNNRKNGYQIRRIRFKAHPGFFMRDYFAVDLCNRTHYEKLKK